MLFLSNNTKRGFTLFEMMVTITIFVLVTLIGVLNYNKFGSDIFISNLAYDVALSIRKAQAYGIDVKGTGGASSVYNYAYGINFNLNGGINAKQYRIFADLNSNGAYDQTPTDESVEQFSLLKNSVVYKLCVRDAADTDVNCGLPGSQLNLTFIRPNPDAIINGENVQYSRACIYLKSSDARIKQIVVYNVGSISVVDNDSPDGCGTQQ